MEVIKNIHGMRCFGNYQDDRICDVCKNLKYTPIFNCKDETKRKNDSTYLSPSEIRSKCGYYDMIFWGHDSNEYGYGCTKNQLSLNDCKACNPSKECLADK